MITDKQLNAAMDAFYPGEDWRKDLGHALPNSLRDMKAALTAAFTPPSERIANHANAVQLAGQALHLSNSHALAEGCFATARFLRSTVQLSSVLETPKMLLLSTSHISSKTNTKLYDKVRDFLAQFERALLPIVFEKGEYGYILPLIDEDDDRKVWAAYPDLDRLRTIAEAAGCTWLMLDRDAETVPDLETYDW